MIDEARPTVLSTTKAKRNLGLQPFVVLAALITLVLIVLVRVPFSRLDVPYTFSSDAVYYLAQIKTVAETGWLFHNDRLGYPFGYDRLDFPGFDSLNYVFLGPIAALTGEPGFALNVYFQAGFYLIGFSALFALRRLDLATTPALVCALAYVFLPYHFLRGVVHPTISAYYFVPLAMLTLGWLAKGELNDFNASGARLRWSIALATALLLPVQMVYYGYFFAVLCVIAGIMNAVRGQQWRSLIAPVILLAATACAFLLEQLPATIHAMAVGKNEAVAAYLPQAAQQYALHLTQLLQPFSHHRIGALADAKLHFDNALGNPPYEIRDEYIGVLGILGLLALAFALAKAVAPSNGRASPQNDGLVTNVRIYALLAVAILVLALPSGLFTLGAYWITPKIHSTTRIFPFFAFASLLGAGWLLQETLEKLRSSFRRLVSASIVGTIALLDVTSPAMIEDHGRTAAIYDSDKAYFERVERQLGDGAAVFQLPVVWFPESPVVGKMADYEEFKPYLFTRTLRFSYGSARGRVGNFWASTVAALPVTDMLNELHKLCYSAILVDGFGYEADASDRLMSELERAVGKPPLVSAEQRWRLFELNACDKRDPGRTVSAVWPPAISVNGEPILFSLGSMGGVYRADNWSDLEQWGVWSLRDSSHLRMRLQPATRVPLSLSIDAIAMVGPDTPRRQVVVSANGYRIGTVTFSLQSSSQLIRFPLPQEALRADGLLDLHFEVSPTSSPVAAGLNDDPRLLGIGLRSLAIMPTDATDGSHRP